jgi:hypothetical protein
MGRYRLQIRFPYPKDGEGPGINCIENSLFNMTFVYDHWDDYRSFNDWNKQRIWLFEALNNIELLTKKPVNIYVYINALGSI